MSWVADRWRSMASQITVEISETFPTVTVVASEVKTLATQTGNATKEIGRQIAAMQEATQEAVVTIKDIDVTIGRVSEISTAIHGAVQQHASATQQIAQYASGAGRRTTDVARD